MNLQVGQWISGAQVRALGFPKVNGRPICGKVVREDEQHYYVKVVTWQAWKALLNLPVLNSFTYLFPKKKVTQRKLFRIK